MMSLKTALLSIDDARRATMLKNVEAVRPLFTYGIPNKPFGEDNMLQLVLFEQWLKKHGADYRPDVETFETEQYVM